MSTLYDTTFNHTIQKITIDISKYVGLCSFTLGAPQVALSAPVRT